MDMRSELVLALKFDELRSQLHQGSYDDEGTMMMMMMMMMILLLLSLHVRTKDEYSLFIIIAHYY